MPETVTGSGRRWSRREFLVAAGASAVAALVPRAGRAAGTDRVLVALFLQGAADGLNLCVPQVDADYYRLRPTLKIPSGTALDLDGFFGLHPSLRPLLPLYRSGSLALVHAVGSPDPTRSHFDGRDFMERGVPGDKSISDGWLNRYLVAIAANRPIAGVRLGGGRGVALAGPAPSLVLGSIEQFRMSGPLDQTLARERLLRARYGSGVDGALASAAQEAFSALDEVGSISTETSVGYPNTSLARALRNAAALIKADIGVRVVTVYAADWDTHSKQKGRLAERAEDLAGSVAAFHIDLRAHANRTVLLAMTEFGRSAAENRAGGTEHGHGGLMLCLGGGVAGGRVLLRNDLWPGLGAGELHEGRDLRVTTDFRDVFAELLDRHLGLNDPRPILPGHAVHPSRYPGLFA